MQITDIKELMNGIIGKNEVAVLSDVLLNHPNEFETLFNWIFSENEKLAFNTAWVVEKVSKKAPTWFSDKKKYKLQQYALVNQHEGIQRLLLSSLNNLPFLQPISMRFVDKCFEQMMDIKRSVSVQVLSMKLLANVSQIEKDFIPELIAYLENCNAENYSAGFLAAKKNVLKNLKK